MIAFFIDFVFVQRYDFFWASDYTNFAPPAFFFVKRYLFHNKINIPFVFNYIFILFLLY